MMNQTANEHRETERLIKELPQGMERMEIRLPGEIYIIDAVKTKKKSAQEKLTLIESLCQVLIKQEEEPPFTQKKWFQGRADAARMILEILSRKGVTI